MMPCEVISEVFDQADADIVVMLGVATYYEQEERFYVDNLLRLGSKRCTL